MLCFIFWAPHYSVVLCFWSEFFLFSSGRISCVAMSNQAPFRNSMFVQQCITSYFPFRTSTLVQQCITDYFPLCSNRCCSLVTVSCDFDSFTDSYVSETPTSKQGNIAYYLGICSSRQMCQSTVVRSGEALFRQAVVTEVSCDSINQTNLKVCFCISYLNSSTMYCSC